MKRKYLTISAVFAIIIIISCKTHFDTSNTDYKAVPSTQNLERGKALTFTTCAGCHYNRGLHKFAGNPMHDVPPIAGKVFSANLTHSKTHGIATEYTDAQIRYLLKTGIAKDGRFLSYMLRPNIADDDINDIITFLRTDDPSLRSADTTVGLTHYSLIGKSYMAFKSAPA